MAKTYDTKCYELAEHFMSDEPMMRCEEACDELSALIQITIEDWISYQRKKHEGWVEAEDAKQIGREALRAAGLPHS